MLSSTKRGPSVEGLEATFEADQGLMRLYSGIWYGSLALFVLWLGCVAFHSL
ncbi:hypothetical protein [Bosea thiooxidans]